MALIVEDGTGKSDAQTYASAEFVIAYADARGVTVASDDAEMLILQAMDYVESFRSRFKGQRNTRTQALSWPRTGAVVDGFEIPSNEIPNELKSAVSAAVIEIVNGAELMPAKTDYAVRMEKVDVISVEYASGGGGQGSTANEPITPSFPAVDAVLNPLLRGGGGIGLRAIRA